MIRDEKDVRDQLVTMWRVAEYNHEVTLKAIDLIDTLQERDAAREGAEHYGPYGANCMYTGQFDAGECWLCYAKRKKKEVKELNKAIDELRAKALDACVAKNAAVTKAGEMQLVAGRYQYQFEQAMKALNSIDDLFEYAYKSIEKEDLQRLVREALATFTKAVKPKGK